MKNLQPDHIGPRPCRELAALVEGASVALVGNSAGILLQKPGRQIDAADVVIRINRGLPGATRELTPDVIGVRTTVWATAEHWPDLAFPNDCLFALWMKLTRLGDSQYLAFVNQNPDPVVRWESELEKECRDFVGADPGTGIRLLWFLRIKANPRSVSCYGMDCWSGNLPGSHVSHWSRCGHTPNHRPDLERAAMMKLL